MHTRDADQVIDPLGSIRSPPRCRAQGPGALEQPLNPAHVTLALKIPVIKMIGIMLGRRYQFLHLRIFCIYDFLTLR